MFGIRDFLFGKKVTVTISNLGTFEARVKKNKQKEIIWTCDTNSAYKNKEVALLLLGDAKKPYQSQIENAHFILKNEESIKMQAVEQILKNTKLQQKFKGQKVADFKLTCIYPYQKESVAYELSYETESGEYIGAIFKDQIVSEVNFDTI